MRREYSMQNGLPAITVQLCRMRELQNQNPHEYGFTAGVRYDERIRPEGHTKLDWQIHREREPGEQGNDAVTRYSNFL